MRFYTARHMRSFTFVSVPKLASGMRKYDRSLVILRDVNPNIRLAIRTTKSELSQQRCVLPQRSGYCKLDALAQTIRAVTHGKVSRVKKALSSTRRGWALVAPSPLLATTKPHAVVGLLMVSAGFKASVVVACAGITRVGVRGGTYIPNRTVTAQGQVDGYRVSPRNWSLKP